LTEGDSSTGERIGDAENAIGRGKLNGKKETLFKANKKQAIIPSAQRRGMIVDANKAFRAAAEKILLLHQKVKGLRQIDEKGGKSLWGKKGSSWP